MFIFRITQHYFIEFTSSRGIYHGEVKRFTNSFPFNLSSVMMRELYEVNLSEGLIPSCFTNQFNIDQIKYHTTGGDCRYLPYDNIVKYFGKVDGGKRGLSFIITFGKYKTMSIQDICDVDFKYIAWLKKRCNMEFKDEVFSYVPKPDIPRTSAIQSYRSCNDNLDMIYPYDY